MWTTVETEKAVVEQPQTEAPAAEKPAKEKKAKAPKEKKPKSTKSPAHPPYFQMIKEALLALNEKTGSSPHAISKYMEDKHKSVLPANFRKILGLQLRNSASKGKLIKIKASYKLSEAGKRVAAPTKPAVANAEKKSPQPKRAAKSAKETEAKKKVAAKPAKKAAQTRKRTARAASKPKQPKSIRSPAAKKAKKGAA